VWVLAGVLLLAGCAIVTHHKCSAGGDGKVKLIHVITPNSSCEGLHTAPIEDAGDGSNSTVNAAVPAAAAGLLASILPLTNFSALTSGQILDAAAAANSTVQQLQPLMQLHQHLWCRWGHNDPRGCLLGATNSSGLCRVHMHAMLTLTCLNLLHWQPLSQPLKDGP
jgi:hypothetical protein